MDEKWRLSALEEENERLREEIIQLRERLGEIGENVNVLQLHFLLTGKEAQILNMLLKHEGKVFTKEVCMLALYQSKIDDPPEIKIVDVFVCKLRKKIKPIEIKTVWGRGYMLDTPNANKLKEIIRG